MGRCAADTCVPSAGWYVRAGEWSTCRRAYRRVPWRFVGGYAESGRRFELVALPDGAAFDLLGMSGRQVTAISKPGVSGPPGWALLGWLATRTRGRPRTE